MAVGRRGQPIRAMPSAIAPLDTRTICLPYTCNWAICSAHCATAWLSMPLPSLVPSDEPTLTTRRLAYETAEDEGLYAAMGRRIRDSNRVVPCVVEARVFGGSEERGVGKESVSPCKSRCSPSH